MPTGFARLHRRAGGLLRAIARRSEGARRALSRRVGVAPIAIDNQGRTMLKRFGSVHGTNKTVAIGTAVGFALLLATGQARAFSGPPTSSICMNGPSAIVATNNGGNNGNLLSHAEVVPIFWGSFWNTNFPQKGEVLGMLQYFLNGPFLDGLVQYAPPSGTGLARPRMSPIAPMNTGDPPNPFNQGQVVNMVNGLIGSGAVPPPLAQGTNMVYMVFMQPGTTSGDEANSDGWNFLETCDSNCGSANGLGYTLIAVYPPIAVDSTSPFKLSLYSYFGTHEIEEAIARNISVTGCENGSYGNGNNPLEVADVCDFGAQIGGITWGTGASADGIAMAPYWSQKDTACILPEGWTTLTQYNGNILLPPLTPPNKTVQVVVGEMGGNCLDTNCTNLVVETKTGAIFKYNDSGDGTDPSVSFTNITPPSTVRRFATISAGQGWVLGITEDMTAVYRYDGTSWTELSLLPFQVFTSIASGKWDIATDVTGSPFVYNNNQWQQAGTPGDQFLVGRYWVAGLFVNHADIFIWPGPGTSWIDTNHSAAEMYIGGHEALAVRDLRAGDFISAMTTEFVNNLYHPLGWQSQISLIGDVALFGNSSTPLVGLFVDRGKVVRDANPIESPNGWTTLETTSVNRLVGHGNSVFTITGVNL